MKKNGHDATGHRPYGPPAVPYRPAPGMPPGLNVAALRDLTAAPGASPPLPALPARPAFHLLVAVRSGALSCSLDFTAHTAEPGDWLWIHPGQVLDSLRTTSDGDGTALIFPTGFLGEVAHRAIREAEHAPSRLIRPDAPRQETLLRLLDVLAAEHRDLVGLPLESHLETLRSLLSVIVMRLAHLVDPHRQGRSGSDELFDRFRRAVEEDFTRTHRLESYAARLGYSPRTITRATRQARGCGAKQYIDDRVLLEAKRLLIYTSLPQNTIGKRIGFTHPTAFSAFFRHRTGMTPSEFRTLTRA
ncbi:helix-turn-helix transcriptional regulator [Kitasatospora sp. NPDC001540]|uniref:helix-turn-helix transcriptional regulator n=1 Tax=Kitasatospora sp. NPDC001540 TaxID=3364014 RepID=UPI0036CF85FC